MEIPSQTKPAIWGAVGGAVVLAVVGFTWGGWSTASSSERVAKLRADNAVVAALSPICVNNFQKQPNADAVLAELKKISSWSQGDFIAKGGWATMVGTTAPDSAVAKACAETLGMPKT